MNSFLSTDIMDLYKDYFYFIYYLPEQDKKQIGFDDIPKDLNQFILEAYYHKLNPVGLIPKRSFGAILERVIEEQSISIERKRSKSIFLQGVGLKTAEGLLAFEKATLLNLARHQSIRGIHQSIR